MTLSFTTLDPRFPLFCPSISEPNVGHLRQRSLCLWTWEAIKTCLAPYFLLSESYPQHFGSIPIQFGAKCYADTLFCPVCLFLWSQAWQMEQHTLVLNYILFDNHTSFSVFRSRKLLQLHLAVEVLEVAVVSSRGQSNNSDRTTCDSGGATWHFVYALHALCCRSGSTNSKGCMILKYMGMTADGLCF
jgi:hypothetical protein